MSSEGMAIDMPMGQNTAAFAFGGHTPPFASATVDGLIPAARGRFVPPIEHVGEYAIDVKRDASTTASMGRLGTDH